MTTEIPTETNPTQTPIPPEPEHLQKIKTTQQQLAQLQKDFHEAIDAFLKKCTRLLMRKHHVLSK